MQKKSKKNWGMTAAVVTELCFVLLAVVNPLSAEAGVIDKSWQILAGYRYIDVNYQYEHDTHPDDSYLPNSNRPGSAGTTEITGSSWFFIGGRFQTLLGEKLSGSLNAGLLLGGDEDKQKNSNSLNNGKDDLYVYSRSSYGTSMAVALNYQASSRIRCGVEGQVTAVKVENGYHRWGSYDERFSEWSFFPSIGPRVDFEINDKFALETSYHFGDNSQTAFALSYTF